MKIVTVFFLLVFAVPGISTPLDDRPSQKTNVAVLEITGSFKDFDRSELSSLSSRFETELMKTGKFQVLERRNMDMILQEQGFQQSGACNTSECQVEIGELLGVEKIITGDISKVGELITINLKMVDVGNGTNELSHALDIKGDMEAVLRGGCWELAQIFSGKKDPGDSHTVLTAEKSSVWPWVIGGVSLAAVGVSAVILLQGDNKTDANKESVIE